MSRKRIHINARHDEWVVVHRPPPRNSSDSPLGCLILIIIIAIFLQSC